MRLKRPEVEALLRVRNGADLAPFKGILEWRSEKARGECTTLSGEQLLRAQGRAQELQELLKLVEEAPSLIDKVK